MGLGEVALLTPSICGTRSTWGGGGGTLICSYIRRFGPFWGSKF